jgi:hypothetical protein
MNKVYSNFNRNSFFFLQCNSQCSDLENFDSDQIQMLFCMKSFYVCIYIYIYTYKNFVKKLSCISPVRGVDADGFLYRLRSYL